MPPIKPCVSRLHTQCVLAAAENLGDTLAHSNLMLKIVSVHS